MICESAHIILFEVEMIQVWINLAPKKKFQFVHLGNKISNYKKSGTHPQQEPFVKCQEFG